MYLTRSLSCKTTASVLSYKILCSRYPKATEIFEAIARQSINNNLLKYSVRGILLNAGICQLCRADPVAIQNSLERYQVYIILLKSRSAIFCHCFISKVVLPCCRKLIRLSQELVNTNFQLYAFSLQHLTPFLISFPGFSCKLYALVIMVK